MTVLTRATMPGALRNGAERGGGTLVHLIENPDGRPAYNLGRDALCGRGPSIMWSDWAPENLKVCPRCAKKAAKLPKTEVECKALCQSGKFETGQGTCALICMDQFSPRSGPHGCPHAHYVFNNRQS